MPIHPTPRPGIMEISPYVGGRSTADGHTNTIKLSSNESALGPSPKAQAAYRELAGTLHRYPDGGATDLRTALGALHGIDPERIVCGNGSDELLQLLAQAYAGPGDEVIYCRHGFLVYPLATLAVGATPVVVPEVDYTADVDAILSRVTERTRIVFLANPNNPTGTYIPRGELRRLWGGLPEHVILVVDSAYAEFVTAGDYDPGLDLAGMAPNVVMTRTFSKAYGLAALRLGWAYAPPAIIDVLHRIRGPFNANAAALAAALAALEDQDHIVRSCRHNEAAMRSPPGSPPPGSRSFPASATSCWCAFRTSQAETLRRPIAFSANAGSWPVGWSPTTSPTASELRSAWKRRMKPWPKCSRPSWRRLRQRRAANGERARALLARRAGRPRLGQLLARAGLA